MTFLAGCGEDKPVTNPVPPGVFAQQAAQAASAPVAAPVAAAPAAPVIINQAPAHDNGLSNALAGAALGYAIGSAGNNNRGYEPSYNDRRYDYGRDRNYYSRPTVVNKTVIVKQYVKEAPKAAPVEPPKSVAVPPSKVIPAAPSPVTPPVAKKLSLDKPKTSSFSSSPSKSSSFGGFSRRK